MYGGVLDRQWEEPKRPETGRGLLHLFAARLPRGLDLVDALLEALTKVRHPARQQLSVHIKRRRACVHKMPLEERVRHRELVKGDGRIQVMLGVVIHVPKVEADKGGRRGRASVLGPILVVVGAVEVVRHVEKGVHGFTNEKWEEPVAPGGDPRAGRGNGGEHACIDDELQAARPLQ